MSDVEITCTPGDGILTVSPDTVAAIDRLAATLPPGPWRLVVQTPEATLRARPADRSIGSDSGPQPVIRERRFLSPDQRLTVHVPVVLSTLYTPVVEVAEEVLEGLLARAGYTPKPTETIE